MQSVLFKSTNPLPDPGEIPATGGVQGEAGAPCGVDTVEGAQGSLADLEAPLPTRLRITPMVGNAEVDTVSLGGPNTLGWLCAQRHVKHEFPRVLPYSFLLSLPFYIFY